MLVGFEQVVSLFGYVDVFVEVVDVVFDEVVKFVEQVLVLLNVSGDCVGVCWDKQGVIMLLGFCEVYC